MLYFNSRFWNFAVISTRIFLGLIFFSSGMGKLMPFPGIIGPVWLIERLAEYDLALYGHFIAYSQVTIGLLLLSQRFATLGAVMCFPLILNILMVTISMHWRGTPYILAVFLLMNIFLLIADYHRLKFILFPRSPELKKQPLRRPHLRQDLLTLAGMGLLLLSPVIYGVWAGAAYLTAGLGLLCLPLAYMLEKRVFNRFAPPENHREPAG